MANSHGLGTLCVLSHRGDLSLCLIRQGRVFLEPRVVPTITGGGGALPYPGWADMCCTKSCAEVPALGDAQNAWQGQCTPVTNASFLA